MTFRAIVKIYGAAMTALYLCLVFPTIVNADLYPRLGGKLVYDDDLDVTWLANGNLAESMTFGVSGISQDGSMNWGNGEALAWVAAMNSANYLGYDSWHLPDTIVDDTSCSDMSQRGYFGTGCTGSDMGHLYYIEFGLAPQERVSPGSVADVFGPFRNIRANTYWSRTSVPDSSRQYTFSFASGGTAQSIASGGNFAWPVLDGDVAITLLRCDLNNNGKVDAGDMMRVLRMVLGMDGIDLDCDINNGGWGDAVIDTADLLVVQQIILGIIPEIRN